MSRRPPLARLPVLLCLLLAQSTLAQSAGGWLPDPAAALQATPDLVLAPQARRLSLVVRAQEPAATLARRYGLPPAAVRLGPVRSGARLAELTLPPTDAARRTLRPASVATYRTRPGDTLSTVAARHGLRVVDLLGTNLDRRSLDALHPGEVLNVPTAETGLLVRIKPGQSALSLIAGYGADPVATARANGGLLPTALREGDELLLPGIQAAGFQDQLLARRAAEQRTAAAQAKLEQYGRFLAWQRARERERLEARYHAQAQYERALAWQRSAERQARVRAYERQVQFEAAQAGRRERERQAARVAAARPRPAATVRAASTAGPGLAWPMRSFRLTSRYGERDIAFHREVFHGGIDLAAPYGTPVYAAQDGQVSQSGYGDYGLNIYTVSGDATLVYGHLSRAAVVAGQSVRQGQLLGYVGCTGICTGPHLHFEVRRGGRTVDPLAALP